MHVMYCACIITHCIVYDAKIYALCSNENLANFCFEESWLELLLSLQCSAGVGEVLDTLVFASGLLFASACDVSFGVLFWLSSTVLVTWSLSITWIPSEDFFCPFLTAKVFFKLCWTCCTISINCKQYYNNNFFVSFLSSTTVTSVSTFLYSHSCNNKMRKQFSPSVKISEQREMATYFLNHCSVVYDFLYRLLLQQKLWCSQGNLSFSLVARLSWL